MQPAMDDGVDLHPANRWELRRCLTAWATGDHECPPADVVALAGSLLAEPHVDGRALRDLAGLDTDDLREGDIDALLPTAMTELGCRVLTDEEAWAAALLPLARAYSDDRAAIYALSWRLEEAGFDDAVVDAVDAAYERWDNYPVDRPQAEALLDDAVAALLRFLEDRSPWPG